MRRKWWTNKDESTEEEKEEEKIQRINASKNSKFDAVYKKIKMKNDKEN